jgi:hypothetical protein
MLKNCKNPSKGVLKFTLEIIPKNRYLQAINEVKILLCQFQNFQKCQNHGSLIPMLHKMFILRLKVSSQHFPLSSSYTFPFPWLFHF